MKEAEFYGLFNFCLIVLALILGPVGIIVLIVDLVKHKSKKNPLILLSISIICFVVSVSLLVTTGSGNTSPNGGSTPAYANNQSSNAMSDEEVFAAKFCMAYMNLLKNPYSFKVQSIWVYDGSSIAYMETDIMQSTLNILPKTVTEQTLLTILPQWVV